MVTNFVKNGIDTVTWTGNDAEKTASKRAVKTAEVTGDLAVIKNKKWNIW